MAAGGRRERRRQFALDRREAALFRLEPRHVGEQRLRVGMVRRAKQFRGRRDLDDAAEIEDHDAIGDVLDHAEIVARRTANPQIGTRFVGNPISAIRQGLSGVY
jgi:hypothetical protein